MLFTTPPWLCLSPSDIQFVALLAGLSSGRRGVLGMYPVNFQSPGSRGVWQLLLLSTLSRVSWPRQEIHSGNTSGRIHLACGEFWPCCCMCRGGTGHYKADNSSSDCQPCPAGTCSSVEGSTSCARCPEDSACPEGCTSPHQCNSWAEHVAVDNSRCHWTTAFYMTVSVAAVGKTLLLLIFHW